MADVLLKYHESSGLEMCDEGEATHRCPEALWRTYRDAVEMVNTIEDQVLAAHEIVEPMPDDLAALVGLLPDEEIQALWDRRRGKNVASAPQPSEILDPEGIEIPPQQDKSPQQIMLEAQARMQARCPHKTQALRGRDVICVYCHKKIISNTQSGVDIMDTRGKVEGQFTISQRRGAVAGGLGEVVVGYEGEVG